MAINPLNLPDPIRQPTIDWSPLARLGEQYGRYREEQDLKDAIKSSLGPNGIDPEKFSQNLFRLGRIKEGLEFSNVAAGERASRDFSNTLANLYGGGAVGTGTPSEGMARGSWYSQLPEKGWVDRQDRPGSNALGVPDSQQGIALPSRATLGQWFDVTFPNGETHRLQQTDVGPAKWTGRGIDISAAGADKAGYTPGTFPTDASISWKLAAGPPVATATPLPPGGVKVAQQGPPTALPLTTLPPSGDLTPPAQAPAPAPTAGLSNRAQALIGAIGNTKLPEGQRAVAKALLDTELKRTNEKLDITWQEDASGRKVPYAVDQRTGTVRQIQVPGATDKPAANPYATGKMTEAQGKDALYASRMMNAEAVLRDPAVAAAAMSMYERGKAGIQSKYPIFGNKLVGKDYQRFEQAQRDFINAVLRPESGAVINPEEFDNARKQYFPQPGDTQETIQQKTLNRVEAIRGTAARAGPGWKPPYILTENGDLVATEKALTSKGTAVAQAKKFDQSKTKIPIEAARMLQSDKDPNARSKFDAVFGEGAAEKVLGPAR